VGHRVCAQSLVGAPPAGRELSCPGKRLFREEPERKSAVRAAGNTSDNPPPLCPYTDLEAEVNINRACSPPPPGVVFLFTSG